MGDVKRIHVVTGGKYHDFDLARLRVLELMAEDERIRASCSMDYDGLPDLDGYAGLVLYTCDLMPTDAQAEAMDDFVRGGGRILALHAVNAHLEFTDGPEIVTSDVRIPGLVMSTAEDVSPLFMNLLGSRFVTHLAAQEIRIHVEDADHPVTRGLQDFTIVDEPYVATPLGELRTLLSACYKGPTPGYVTGEITDDPPRPQLYVKDHGKGGVLYSPLGHACGKYDMRPLMAEAPVVRGPWDDSNYLEIVKRGIGWLADASK
ncbi:ThuA domain-containing protein [Croceicoccus ponticola]|uniref:ThuA domain-containing protein n=1 Tax=Croceicoccus ponticola TaxID=2217664 RepID=A0A437GTW7_9SPHN|nr:ThuA domain-containing protein [Croceicoccus ponticola]RVQ64602.1 ThuA domain-containing protein [Croceicoccus ponticola]